MKKNFSINLDIDLKLRLDSVAKSKFESSSSIINALIIKYLEEVAGLPEKEKPLSEKKMTEEERIAEWKWRKSIVAQGNMDAWYGEEYPIQPKEEMKALAEHFRPYK